MSLPTAVFIDTSVFEGQHFNFESAAFVGFVDAVKSQNIPVLMPDPTRREVSSHITKRSIEALEALEKASRKAPFLRKWSGFPTLKPSQIEQWQVQRIAREEWGKFLGSVETVSLDYSGVQISSIMDWYFNGVPPFGPGSKRKEFPDAFTIAILLKFAQSRGQVIAVVSADQDMKTACARYPELLSFSTLPELTELLLLGDAQVDATRAAVLSDLSLLEDEVMETCRRKIVFVHPRVGYDLASSEITGLTLENVRLVSLGQNQCTVTFEVNLEAEHEIVWEEEDEESGRDVEERRCVALDTQVSGYAKLELKSTNHAIESILAISIDRDFVEVDEAPRHRW